VHRQQRLRRGMYIQERASVISALTPSPAVPGVLSAGPSTLSFPVPHLACSVPASTLLLLRWCMRATPRSWRNSHSEYKGATCQFSASDSREQGHTYRLGQASAVQPSYDRTYYCTSGGSDGQLCCPAKG
jgi:hypothetical protein